MDDSSAQMQCLKYQAASNVNVSNFVSDKLSSNNNYPLWKAQMLCLMESQEMRGIVDNLFDNPGATYFKTVKQYDSLLKDSLGKFIQIEISAVTEPTEIDTIRKEKLLNATVKGRWWEAESILENYRQAATEAISDDGNTMLHLAVETGQNDFVKQLLDFIKDGKDIEKKNSDGRTALHIAAIVGNKYAAELLVNRRKELVGIADYKAIVPLSSAYYNMKLETFAYLLDVTEIKEQSHSLGFIPSSDPLQSKVNLLITLIFTKQYDLASTWVNKYPELVTRDDKVLMAMVKTFPMEPIKRIDKKKQDYINAKNILNLVCGHIDRKWGFSGSSHPCYSQPILEAACQDSHEVVKEILVRSPKTIGSKLINGHNLIQLAVINRSEKVYNFICHFVERMDLSILDSSNNNILHLAGRLAPSSILSCTTGAALQLQRELQWRKEVEKFMLPTELVEKNIDMETPEMVFTREHKTLMKEGEKWMKTTAESCSITAALITTIVFAAAITVPGGSNQQTGIPLFRNDIAFTIFAVSDAISLFASSTALLVFLSILTARFSAQDFLVSLPRRLIIGLCTLFLSTFAMMVAFSAILFLVFCDQRTWMLAPIGGLACFPIAAIVTLQFPLVVDLILSTHRPIFLADCSKSNMNIMRSSFTKQGSYQVRNSTSINHGTQAIGYFYKADPPTA
ncbi:hypothetical protein L6452_26750 [Arctium lappa]|uniref:Uncharacterized protein n=1 Tax=Arctium lappa TaxID=4217 RepID=A0ACB8ZV53_ARCLA|nr:hypothetical protein L6452_26750 [Arctium lappa]